MIFPWAHFQRVVDSPVWFTPNDPQHTVVLRASPALDGTHPFLHLVIIEFDFIAFSASCPEWPVPQIVKHWKDHLWRSQDGDSTLDSWSTAQKNWKYEQEDAEYEQANAKTRHGSAI